MADFTLVAGDLLPIVTATLKLNGTPVDLTDATVQFVWIADDDTENIRTAAVSYPVDQVDLTKRGKVQYGWVTGDTDDPGEYRIQWRVVFPVDLPMTFPNDESLITFEIFPVLAPASTPLSTFHKPLRAILGDYDPDIHTYDGDQLNNAMGVVLNLGRVTGDPLVAVEGYFLSSDELRVRPALKPSTDVKAYAQLLYHTSKMFVVNLTSESFRTRAFSRTVGDSYHLIHDILGQVYYLENGEGMG